MDCTQLGTKFTFLSLAGLNYKKFYNNLVAAKFL